MIKFRFKATYNWDLDGIKAVYILIPVLILAILFHPSLNNSTPFDVNYLMFLNIYNT